MTNKNQVTTWADEEKCKYLQNRFGDYDEFQKKGGNKPNKIPIFDLMNILLVQHQGKLELLEVGCGPGHFLWSFKENVSKLIGLDYFPHMLKLAKAQLEKYNVKTEFIEGSCWLMPFQDNYTDISLQVDVCMHIGGSWEAIKEMIRVSKKYVVFTGPSFEDINIMDKQIKRMAWAVSRPLLTKELDKMIKEKTIKNFEFLNRLESETYKHKILFITL